MNAIVPVTLFVVDEREILEGVLGVTGAASHILCNLLILLQCHSVPLSLPALA